jgi:transporter family protein
MAERGSGVAIVLVLASVVVYGIWGTLGKAALRHLSWPQVSIFYGVGILVVVGIVLATSRRTSWSPHGVWIAAVTGFLGALGLVLLYLALDRGNPSVVFALFSLFPVVTVVLSAIFLDESISALQIAGIGCAVAAVALVSLG